MAEADATATADLTPELDRIEAATDAGDTDLKALGFWRIVARVKADPALVDRHADQIGRIDTAAFRRGVRLRVPVWVGNALRVPVWVGNALLVAGMVVGVAAVVVARTVSSATVAGLLLIAAAVVWTVAFHCPTHWIVGRIVGIRFTDYFLGGPPPPRPGLKSDYATYLRADPNGRAWMHASGAIATKLAPFLALALWPGSGAPGWSAIVLVALGVLQIGTDVAFSVKTSDWKKFRRERAVAKGRAAR